MRKAWILFVLGIWLAILPYTGFPYSWKNVLTTFTGLGIIFFSYIFYKENQEKNFDNFVENNNFNQKEIIIETKIEEPTAEEKQEFVEVKEEEI